jgi:hypothetical protein
MDITEIHDGAIAEKQPHYQDLKSHMKDALVSAMW